MSDFSKVKTNPAKNSITLKKEKNDEKIKIDFSYFLFPNVSFKVFTNFLRNEKECFEKLQIFYRQALPHIQDRSFQVLENENKHCHPIDKTDKVHTINKILGKYQEKYPELTLPTYTDFGNEFYQLHIPNGIRAIGVRRGNTFIILFIDFHHLLYSDPNYNNQDYGNYSFETHKMFLEEKNITLVSITDEMLNNSNCLYCEHLEKMTS